MKSKRRKSLGGVVLVMVMIVMFVLIIMLLATLTVVQTAGQRINTKYEENQAYYTARSALDVFTLNMLSDGDYKAYDSSGIRKYPNGTDTTGADMYQGLGLELDMYSLRALAEGANPSDPIDYSKNVPQAAFIASGESANHIEYQTYFGIGSSPSTEITYNITNFPVVSGTNSGAGKLLDQSGTVYTNATIKVKVLDRKYDYSEDIFTGGASAGYSKTYTDEADLFSQMNNSMVQQDYATAIIKGSRRKDTMKVKITATVEYMGYEGTAILIYDTNEPPVNNSSRAITAFGGATSSLNHTFVVGGASMASPTGTTNSFQNEGGVYGSVYNEASLEFNVKSPIYLTKSEYVFVGEKLTIKNDMIVKSKAGSVTLDERPFIYVGGETVHDNANMTGIGGTGDEAVDLITHGLTSSTNSFKLNGNIYCDGNCTFTSTGGIPDINGDLYINGDLKVAGNCVSIVTDTYGNVIGGTITLSDGGSCNVHVKGDICIGKNGTWNGSEMVYTYTTVASTAVINNSGSLDTSFSGFTLPAVSDIIGTTGTAKTYEINLPGGVKKKIDSHKQNYDEYYATDTNGNYKDLDGDGNVPDRKTPQEMAGEDFTNSTFQDGAVALTYGAAIDTTSGATKYIMNPGSYGTVTITGGGTVDLILSNPWGNFNHTEIVVDDNTTLKVYGCNAGSEYKFEEFSVWTATSYDAWKNGAALNAGNAQVTGYTIKVPKIYYYFDGGKVSCSNDNNFFTGYFFGPTTDIWQKGGVTFSSINYNGKSVTYEGVGGTPAYGFLGSVLCNDFSFQNEDGIIYINPALADDSDPGKPFHNWTPDRYSRN